MAEYIEKEAAVKFARHAYNQWNLAMAAADGKREINLVYKRQELCKAVESVFADSPAADVAPVVHGRWLPEHHKDKVSQTEYHSYIWYHCSECGRRLIGYRDPREAPYCHCGAKMDLKEEL